MQHFTQLRQNLALLRAHRCNTLHNYNRNIASPSSSFTLLCGVDVSRETPPSCASSLDNSLSDKSFLMLSNHLCFGLPLLLFPGTSIPITLFPTFSSSPPKACPYHFNLLSCTFLDISPTFVVPLILSFLILSILVTPLIHLNILNSSTSNFFFCAFLAAPVSAPYIIAGLTTVLYTFLLTLKLILRSHRISNILFQFFHPDCILCVIPASKSPTSSLLVDNIGYTALCPGPGLALDTIGIASSWDWCPGSTCLGHY